MKNRSIWQSVRPPLFKALNHDISCTHAIIGGGLCGLLTAYSLIEKGEENIVIIEAKRLLSGVTANTTAKITSQHGLIYDKIISSMGESYAQQYAAANQNAVEKYRDIIERNGIDCDLQTADAFVYTTQPKYVEKITKEYEAAQALKIPASLEQPDELPFEVKAALKFSNQASFHPLKFGIALINYLKDTGKCRIYEKTVAFAMEDHTVLTKNCRHVKAEKVAVCTHYPFINKTGLYFMKIFQQRAYAVAFPYEKPMKHMYKDCQNDGLSLRGYIDNQTPFIILGGQSHKSGHQSEETHYEELIKKVNLYYGDTPVQYKWSTQDCMTMDEIPYIGPLKPEDPQILLATGFNKWGMTHSLAAATILAEFMTTGKAENADVFSPERRNIKGQAKQFVVETLDVGANFLTGLMDYPKFSVSLLKPGYGGIFRHNGEKIGAYMDKDGKVYAVNTTCTHMGCPLKWNMEEQSWDCPCHGSRFDCKGNILSGPALKGLEPIFLGVNSEEKRDTKQTKQKLHK